ncbi:MAG: VWA domain-containing protein [Promethearchaeota archaeon]|nr:MAG: VWA domain-containing protein [Candidatus Lokiarchaeota archaeon]
MISSKISKKKLSQKEERTLELAKTAWARTMVEFYFPPLNEPNYVFDYTQKEGFYIDPDHKWQITMNLAETPLFKNDEDYIKYFHSISMHEVGHYEIIPYDGLIHANLLKAAMNYVNQNFAPIIVNIFADLIIDTILYRKYPELILWEVKTTYGYLATKYKDKLSDFSRFLFRTYEKIWKVNLIDKHLLSKRELLQKIENQTNTEEKRQEIITDNAITKKEIEEIEIYNSLSTVDNLANKVANEILKDFEDETKWEKKVSNISRILKGLINDTFTLIGKFVKSEEGKTRRKAPGKGGGAIDIPEDIIEIMDNPLENKNRDKLKEDNEDDLRRKSEEFAKNTPYSEFGSPADQAGILHNGNPLATWYRGLARNLIQIKIFEQRPGGQLPVYPDVWRIGDPLEELDIVQTILNSPIIIPNITTRKWVFKEGPGYMVEKEIPDLLIVLDSSGSMNWNYTAKTDKGRGEYHTALIASFAALHYAASKGVKFSIINFSGHADICPWTNDYNKAEQTLLKYQGSGTILPLKAIASQCEKAERKALIFIITDFGIYNWSKSKKILINLANRGHNIVGFFIGAASIPQSQFKDLLGKITLYPIKNPKDLINLVIEEVKKYYI